MSNKSRWDKCKCGARLHWDPYEDHEIVCGKCKTKYIMDCDTVMVYWLVEEIERSKPYSTNPR